jgi:hypothetical protein
VNTQLPLAWLLRISGGGIGVENHLLIEELGEQKGEGKRKVGG